MQTDCFIICFAVNDRSSFNNLGTIWLPEIEANAPSVPYIFVCKHSHILNTFYFMMNNLIFGCSQPGTKSELRTQLPPSDLLTPEEIEAFRSSPTGGASPVVETGDDLASINAMLKVAVKTALDHQKKERELKNTGSNSFCTIVWFFKNIQDSRWDSILRILWFGQGRSILFWIKFFWNLGIS